MINFCISFFYQDFRMCFYFTMILHDKYNIFKPEKFNIDCRIEIRNYMWLN